ncbi:MAG: immune inhibitor A, partial [Planctomycetes bacterium]|nr:immune inhibitor A [Planctomycetota bacterium]
SGLTKIYINADGGTIYEYDSANWSREVVVVASTGAFSISSGPAANTLYLQISSYSAGPLHTYDLVTGVIADLGGAIPGNALGEGRNGLLYAGSGVELYSVDPNSGAATYVGDGADPFAGDLAVDPTSGLLYAATNGRRGAVLVTVDRATGAQTEIGPLGINDEIWGMGFSGNGQLFAAGPDGTGAGVIYSLDKATGGATPVRALTYRPFDMATQPYTQDEVQNPGAAGGGGASGTGVYYHEGFDAGPHGLQCDAGVWDQRAPLDGPCGAASGATCLMARALAGGSGSLLTPTLDLANADRPVFVLKHWYDLTEDQVGATVRVRTAHGSAILEPGTGLPRRGLRALRGSPGFSGSSRGWRDAWFDLTPFAGEEVQLELTFAADGVNDAPGWFVDDLLVAEAAVVEARLGKARLDAAGACSQTLSEGLALAPEGSVSSWRLGELAPALVGSAGVHGAQARASASSAPGPDRLVTEELELAGARRAVLQLTHAYATEPGRAAGRLVVSVGGGPWEALAPLGGYGSLGGRGVSGSSHGLEGVGVDLTPYTSSGSSLRLGFELSPEVGHQGHGWAVARARVLVER